MFVNTMPRYEILSEEAMDVLDRGWRRIVSELGVEFALREAVELFEQAGSHPLALLGGVAGGGDSSRALHGVITGIGFLGAGAIVKGDDGQAGGLTTAATIFVVAAIGATTGAGYPILATGSAVLVLVVLRGLQRFDPAGRTNGSRSVVDGSAGELSGRLVQRSQVRTSPLPSSSSVPGKTRRRQGSSRRAPNASEVGPSDQAGTIAGS